jgi:hypothetical protein
MSDAMSQMALDTPIKYGFADSRYDDGNSALNVPSDSPTKSLNVGVKAVPTLGASFDAILTCDVAETG